MKNFKTRQNKIRQKYKKTEIDLFINRALRKSNLLGFFFQNRLKKNQNTKLINSCIITGRTRGVLRKFGLSRNAIKSLGSQKLIFGLRKSS